MTNVEGKLASQKSQYTVYNSVRYYFVRKHAATFGLTYFPSSLFMWVQGGGVRLWRVQGFTSVEFTRKIHLDTGTKTILGNVRLPPPGPGGLGGGCHSSSRFIRRSSPSKYTPNNRLQYPIYTKRSSSIDPRFLGGVRPSTPSKPEGSGGRWGEFRKHWGTGPPRPHPPQCYNKHTWHMMYGTQEFNTMFNLWLELINNVPIN
jgi:hypothetical protein